MLINLCIKVSDSLYSSIINNISIYKYVETIFTNIFTLLKLITKKEFLDTCLSILEIHLKIQKDPISFEYLQLFGECIKTIDGKIPSKETIQHLNNLLSLSNNCSNFYHIRKPSVIPLILKTYEGSQQHIKVLEKFISLCKYSEINYKYCVEGDLDYILIKFVSLKSKNGSVNYRGMNINFEFSFKEIKKIILPFLSKIIIHKSSYGTANQFLKILTNNIDEISLISADCLLKSIVYSSGIDSNRFNVGAIPKLLTSFNIDKPTLDNDIKISFDLMIDLKSIFSSNISLYLFTILDDMNQTSISIFLNQSSLYLCYEHQLTRAVFQIVRILPLSKGYFNFRITFEHNQDILNVVPKINGNQFRGISLRYEGFDSDNFKLFIGGFENASNEWIGNEIGYIFNFTFNEKTIYKDKSNNMYEKYSANIIDFILNERFINSLCSFFKKFVPYKFDEYPKKLLCIIDGMFSLSNEIQLSFNSVDNIYNYLMSNINLLNYDMFLIIVSIFEHITYKPLLHKWIESLLLNMWLWTRSDPKTLKAVLNYLSHSFVIKYQYLFHEMSIFRTLLNQFIIIFCFKDNEKLIPEISIPDFCVFSSKYTKNDIILCRSIFQRLIERIVRLNIENTDIDIILYHLYNSTSYQTISSLLDIILCIDDNFLSEIQNNRSTNSLYHFLTHENIDIVEKVLLVIYKMSGNEISQKMIAAALALTSSKMLPLLFERITAFLPQYPNFHFFLSIIALELKGNYLNLVSASLHSINQKIFDFREFWYLFPLLIALNGTENDMYVNGKFLSSLIMHSKQPIKYFDEITQIIGLIEAAYNYDYDFCYQISTNILSSKVIHADLYEYCFIKCFCSLFMCYLPKEIDDIDDEYQNSIFYTKQITKNDNISYPPLTSIGHIEHFFASNFTNYMLKFSTKYYKQEKLNFLIKIYQSHKDLLSNLSHLFIILEYFSNRVDIDLEKFELINNTFESFQALYDTEIKNNIKKLSQSIISTIRNALIILSKVTITFNDFKNVSFQILDNDINNAFLKFDIPEHILPTKKRSSQLGPICLPYLIVNSTKKPVINEPNPKSPLFTHKCFRIKLSCTTQYLFNLYESKITLCNKIINLKDIIMILTRRISNRSSGIEIFLNNGKNYFLDFIDIEYSVVLKALLDVSLPSIQLLQKSISSDLFASMNLTYKWCNHLMSNFEYILKINLISGRSFNDINLYPIFPSILSDFNSLNPSDKSFNYSYKDPIVDYIKIPFNDKYDPSWIINKPSVVSDIFFFQYSWSNKLLPKWASNTFDFIYLNRKILESEYVSSNLNKWIDKNFGKKHSSIPHRQIFISSHPKRNKFVSKNQQLMKITYPGIIVNNKASISSLGKINLLLTLENGNLIKVNIKTNDFNSSQYEIIDSIPYKGNLTMDCDTKEFIVFEKEKRLITFLSSDAKLSKTFSLKSETNYIYVKNGFIVYCPNLSTFASVEIPNQPVVLWNTTASIVSVHVNWNFKVIIYATTNGSVVTFGIYNLHKISHTKFNTEVLKILMTHLWGIVLLLFKNKLVLMNIHGEIIKVSNFDYDVQQWFTFTRNDGFDYVAFSTQENEIYVFEAYYPDRVSMLFKAEEKVLGFDFDNMNESLLTICTKGTIYLKSIQIDCDQKTK